MEAFNQAYDEFTGGNCFKNENSLKGCHVFSSKSSPKDRTQDRKLLFKISSLLEKKEIEVTSYPEDLFEEQEFSDTSDIDVSGEQGYSRNEEGCDKNAKDVVFTKNGCDEKVKLTDEEKDTFVSEGLPVPILPLTKAEERALKRIRRKIKNKLSAQESRRKKKEYVEGLEKRVETCNSENSILRQKVDSLESTSIADRAQQITQSFFEEGKQRKARNAKQRNPDGNVPEMSHEKERCLQTEKPPTK